MEDRGRLMYFGKVRGKKSLLCIAGLYILGGLLWFAVPFSLATALGLTALALDLPLSAAEVRNVPILTWHFGSLAGADGYSNRILL